MGKTVIFKNGVSIVGGYSIVGQKEKDGPLGKTFSKCIGKCCYYGEKTHEGAERKMFEEAIAGAIEDSKLDKEQIDLLFAGDLLNQIISSSFAARTHNIAFVGTYGACSTMALTLATAACMIEGGSVNTAVCAAGSHFATAERQFRQPLELGNQRPPQSQWTVTGVGATVLAGMLGPVNCGKPKIASVTFGKVVDFGVNDVNNMGASMAPECYIL